jgi:trigger factor
VKVTTEKLPKSLLALHVELNRDQVEKGLDRAARKISQNVNIPGFRKGKAPRFIVENYYGRAALLEEASEDLVNRYFREVLKEQNITPVGQSKVQETQFESEPYYFIVHVPVNPTVTLPDYRSLTEELEVTEVGDDMLEQAMFDLREKHVVLRDLEEARPAQRGDQLTAQIESFIGDDPVEERDEGEPIPDSQLILESERLVPGLCDALIGIEIDETRETTVHIGPDHQNEKVRDQDVLFRVTAKQIRERVLPDWEELPTLEEFEGTLEELRAKTHTDLIEGSRISAERAAVNSFVDRVVEQTTFDIPDTLIEQEAAEMLEEQGQQFARYGITLEQMLQYRGKTKEDAIKELLPDGEERLKRSLVLRNIAVIENLQITNEEVGAEIDRVVTQFGGANPEQTRAALAGSDLRMSIINNVMNQKLNQLLVQIATGQAPTTDTADTTADTEQPTVAAES